MSFMGKILPFGCGRTGALALILFGGLFEDRWAPASAIAQENAPAPSTPARRIRRRYDGRVQVHNPGETVVPPPAVETQKNARVDLRMDPSPVNLLSPSTPSPSPVSFPKPVRSPQPHEEKKDDLWIILPADILLGANLQHTNTVSVGSWGWLADSIDNIRIAQRGEQARVDVLDTDEEEVENENSATERREEWIERKSVLQVVAPPAPFELGPRLEPWPLSKSPGAAPQRFPLPALRPEEQPERDGRRGDESPMPSGPSSPPSFPGISSRIEEIAGAHGPAPATLSTVNIVLDGIGKSSEVSLMPLVRTVPGHSSPESSRQMMIGSPENYGRRGDIFSSSFQSSSVDLPGARISVVSETMPTSFSSFSGPAMSPVLPSSDRPRPLLDFREIMRPFDPAGRPLTDFERRR